MQPSQSTTAFASVVLPIQLFVPPSPTSTLFHPAAPQGLGAKVSAGVGAPDALAVDHAGNLYVAGARNNRILRYPAPFAQSSVLLKVDLIIGQKDLNGALSNQGQPVPSAKTISLA